METTSLLLLYFASVQIIHSPTNEAASSARSMGPFIPKKSKGIRVNDDAFSRYKLFSWRSPTGRKLKNPPNNFKNERKRVFLAYCGIAWIEKCSEISFRVFLIPFFVFFSRAAVPCQQTHLFPDNGIAVGATDSFSR